ncbi:DUF3953 domain-containing protein [Lysinibacillus irui]|uniref:DUF3953 domain-containing protein n=1 Tax=Lysinibacillus irui TaxID=2998077 RepID=UPI0040449163
MSGSLGLQLLLAVVIIVISVYGLVTKDFTFLPVTFTLLGLTFVLIGVKEWRKANKSAMSIVSFGTACFLFLVVALSFFP